jgi:ribonuclease-3
MKEAMNERRKEIKEFLNTIFSIETDKIELYNEALTHSGSGSPDNQRLALLGDSVLLLIMREHCFREHPDWNTERITTECQKIEKDEIFAKTAIKLKIVDRMNIKNPPPNLKTNIAINENVFEALFGAIYLDKGLDKAQEIAKKLKIF